jgi:hypothetical protein
VVHDLECLQETFGRHPAVEEVAEEELFLVVLSDVEIKCRSLAQPTRREKI